MSAKPDPRIPAGSAKNEIPHSAHMLASSLPDHVTGITSPYPKNEFYLIKKTKFQLQYFHIPIVHRVIFVLKKKEKIFELINKY